MKKRLNTLSIAEASGMLQKKEISSVELTRSCLDAIAEKDDAICAYLAVFEDSALVEAGASDARRAEGGERGVLDGIPMALKDNILLKDSPCTAGSKILENYIASYDATVVGKLKEAGAVFLGKTNMDEFAMGSSTENSAFQKTRNPHDHTRVPGGSSGGSAAAVAADECIYALGSDTGGSIRQPASFCGVVGLKPTYGSVSRHGLMAMASSFDQIGSLAKTVDDTFTVFNAISGKDPYDATTVATQSGSEEKKQRPIRVGVPEEYFIEGMDAATEAIVRKAIDNYGSLTGAEIVPISLPHTDYALATYYILMPAEVSSNLARFDGIRYGFSKRTKESKLIDIYRDSRGKGFGAEVRSRIIFGTYVLSAGYYDAYYVKAQKVRTRIVDDFKKAFEAVDVIMTPTAPTPAFAFGEKSDIVSMYLSDVFTVPINIAGVPALSLKAGAVDIGGKKIPVGIQLIGKWFDEPALHQRAKELEAVIAK